MIQMVQYQEYTIETFSYPLRDSKKWRCDLSISWNNRGTIKLKHFSTEVTCATEVGAHAFGIDFGKRIIDGKVPGLSLN